MSRLLVLALISLGIPLGTKANPLITIDIPESIGISGGVDAGIRSDAARARLARALWEKNVGEGLCHRAFALSPVTVRANLPEDGVKDLTFPPA